MRWGDGARGGARRGDARQNHRSALGVAGPPALVAAGGDLRPRAAVAALESPEAGAHRAGTPARARANLGGGRRRARLAQRPTRRLRQARVAMAPEGTAHVAPPPGARAGKARRARAQSVVRVTPAVASAEREEDDFRKSRRGDARRGECWPRNGLRRPQRSEPARRGRLRVDLRGARGPAPGDPGSGGVRAGLDHRRVSRAARPAVAVPRRHGRGGGGASRGGRGSRRRSDSLLRRRRRRQRRRRRVRAFALRRRFPRARVVERAVQHVAVLRAVRAGDAAARRGGASARGEEASRPRASCQVGGPRVPRDENLRRGEPAEHAQVCSRVRRLPERAGVAGVASRQRRSRVRGPPVRTVRRRPRGGRGGDRHHGARSQARGDSRQERRGRGGEARAQTAQRGGIRRRPRATRRARREGDGRGDEKSRGGSQKSRRRRVTRGVRLRGRRRRRRARRRAPDVFGRMEDHGDARDARRRRRRRSASRRAGRSRLAT